MGIVFPDSLSAVKIIPAVAAIAIFLLFKTIDSDKTQLNDLQRFNLPDLTCFFVDFAQSKRPFIIFCFKKLNLFRGAEIVKVFFGVTPWFKISVWDSYGRYARQIPVQRFLYAY